MKIEWHLFAEKDPTEIVTYIAQDNPQAAYNILDAITEHISLLAEHPLPCCLLNHE